VTFECKERNETAGPTPAPPAKDDMTEQHSQAPERSGGHSPAVPIAMLLVAMLSVQWGASIAKALFPILGATNMAVLRILFSTLFMAIALRPWKIRLDRGNWRALLLYGLALGSMNLTFYQALERIPMGIAVAIEFVGPLGVVIATSRRAVDFLWALLAIAGLALLTPLGPDSHDLDPVGMGFALLAGLFWAIYILAGKRAGQDHGSRSAAAGMLISSALALPFGVATASPVSVLLPVLPLVLAVGLLSGAIPYTLEMVALRRMRPGTFGILMSLEPAIAAMLGALTLQEHLPLVHWVAICAVMTASAGAVLTAARTVRVADAP